MKCLINITIVTVATVIRSTKSGYYVKHVCRCLLVFAESLVAQFEIQSFDIQANERNNIHRDVEIISISIGI